MEINSSQLWYVMTMMVIAGFYTAIGLWNLNFNYVGIGLIIFLCSQIYSLQFDFYSNDTNKKSKENNK